jgi:arylsulfatase A-like enzyme
MGSGGGPGGRYFGGLPVGFRHNHSVFAAHCRSMLVVCALALACGAACRAREPETPAAPIRLVDLYKPAPAASASPTGVDLPPPVEWRFAPAAPVTAGAAAPKGPEGGAKPPAWTAGPGVQGLTVRDGRLAGRTTADVAMIDLERPPSEDRDVVHEVQVRMRASAGANLSVVLRPTEKVDAKAEAETVPIIPWPFNSPLVPGDEMRTYALRTTASVPAAFRHVLVRPTDAPGATFEIESVRVVTRREHLAGVSAGLGWHGLSEVYREALVARAPDALSFEVHLPARPRLELAVGTIENAPVTFRVRARERGGDADDTLLERTVTTAHRWETATVDLARLAGRDVTLSLVLASERPRALGFWGTPVIRSVPEKTADKGNTSPPTRPQGVILVWMDTLRRDHLPMYGYARPTTPNLARIAAEGTIFDDCVAQATWTKASGPSILTGLYPSTHGVQSFNDLLPSSATTIAEVYRQAGYATLGLETIIFVGKFSNQHQGFEELHEQGSFPERQAGSTKAARTEVDRLIPWLAAHRDVPFFVLLHLADAHSPHRPYPPYDSMFGDPRGREQHDKETEKVRPFIQNATMRPRGMPTRDELAKAGVDAERWIAYEKDGYDGSIRAMDAELGRLRERLGEMGLDRRTLIAFLADHGEEFLEHGRTFHNQSVYGELTGVPLFFWWPGRVPAGRRAAETVELIDVMPTLLELSGLAPPKGIQGASLVTFMSDGAHPGWPRPAITEAAGRPDPTVAPKEESYALSLGEWKLAHHVARPPTRPEFELFDRKKDPLDSTNVAAQHPEIVARLLREMEAWRRMAVSARLKPDSALATTVSGEELERLRALGYVQ